jgi:hypothetical protein
VPAAKRAVRSPRPRRAPCDCAMHSAPRGSACRTHAHHPFPRRSARREGLCAVNCARASGRHTSGRPQGKAWRATAVTHASEWSVSGWNISTLSVRCFSHDSSSSLTAGRAARNSGPSSAVEYIVVHGYLELPMEGSHGRRGHTSARVHSTDGEAKSASGRGQTAGSSRAFQSV